MIRSSVSFGGEAQIAPFVFPEDVKCGDEGNDVMPSTLLYSSVVGRDIIYACSRISNLGKLKYSDIMRIKKYEDLGQKCLSAFSAAPTDAWVP